MELAPSFQLSIVAGNCSIIPHNCTDYWSCIAWHAWEMCLKPWVLGWHFQHVCGFPSDNFSKIVHPSPSFLFSFAAAALSSSPFIHPWAVVQGQSKTFVAQKLQHEIDKEMAEFKKAQVRAAQNSYWPQQNKWLLHGLNIIYLGKITCQRCLALKLIVLIQVEI
jgi:hypothetical protein